MFGIFEERRGGILLLGAGAIAAGLSPSVSRAGGEPTALAQPASATGAARFAAGPRPCATCPPATRSTKR
jgi:hypothetical protein